MMSNLDDGKHLTDDSSWIDMAGLIGVPMALRAALQLNVPKIIDSAGPSAALSATEICSHLQLPEANFASNPSSPQNLEKILDLLGSQGILSVSVETTGSEKVKKYGLTAKARPLLNDPIKHLVLMTTAPEVITVWANARDIVLHPEEGLFEKVHGKGNHYFAFMAEKNPEWQQDFVKLLISNNVQMQRFLDENYKVYLQSLKGRVVDVGGQEGAVSAALAEKYPHLRFVNFDLPEVVRTAPQFPGVEHIGGSFLDGVPQAEMLIMKFVLLNWDDQSCFRILKNCHNALPEHGGKMVLVDRINVCSANEYEVVNREARIASAVTNLGTAILFKGARTRTFEELETMAKSAGFQQFRVVSRITGMDFMEFTKNPSA